jgi:transcriptional regulator with XRE-family HTH domain
MRVICMVVLCMTASDDIMADSSLHERVGRELRSIREAAGLSGSAVARDLGWSQSKVSRVETGRFGASLGEVASLLDFYGVAEEVRAEILSWVARDDGAAGTWVVRAGGPARRQAEVGAAETRVKSLLQYQALWFPGLLQSPEYSLAIARAGRFPKPETIAERRQTRQRDLRSGRAAKYQVVIEGGALLRSPSDSGVLMSQLVYAADAVDAGFVDLRIRAEGKCPAAFTAGSFVLYDFRQGPPVVLVEAQTADLYVSAETDVLAYRRLFKDLQRDSLDAAASRDLIEETRRQLAS